MKLIRNITTTIGVFAIALFFNIPSVWAEHDTDKNDNVLANDCPNIIVSGFNVSCYGDNDGSAQVNIFPAGNYYTIYWSNGSNSSSINGLSVGTYTVTVKNNNTGCSVVGAYVVESPDPINVVETINHVKCYGQPTGSISITVTGGNSTPSNMNYSWKNSSNQVVSTSQNLSSALADTYTLTVTDSKGCSFTKSYVITQPNEAIDASALITDVACFSTSTGKIDLSVWGGTPGYSFIWNNGATTEDINNVSEGTYFVQITDYNGCIYTNSYYVGQPTQVTGSLIINDVNCFGESTGSLEAVITGGTPPYSYSWKNSEHLYSSNDPVLPNVPADGYEVIVTDARGCKITLTGTVNQPTKLELNYTYNDISCFGGNDGNIFLVATGGVPDYQYSWTADNGYVSTGQDATSLYAGTYTVVVTDQHGCTETITQELTQPLSPINVEVTKVDVLCYGNNTGEITLGVTGGTTPYTYQWSTGQTTANITDLVAMIYNYLVTDGNGCTYSGVVEITQPDAPLLVTHQITDVNCFGESNGTIDLTVTGGTAPYGYFWTNSSYNLSTTIQDLVNFPADTYTYLVTDANGCTETASLTITEPPLLETTLTGVDILCKYDNTGSVDLTVIGGTLDYNFVWNNGEITEDLNNLYAGHYAVVVTDDHGCEATNSITLIEPDDSLSYTFKYGDVKCNNGQDGWITLEVEGGTFPYFYTWSNGGTTAEITDLSSGNYTFLVTDDHGCTMNGTMFIDQPDPLLLNEEVTDVTCFGFSDGIIDITPTGGTIPYQFTWFNSDYVLAVQDEDLVHFPADVYQVEVVDSNGCFNEFFINLPEPDLLEIFYEVTDVTCYGESNGSIMVEIIGGNPAYNTLWNTGDTTQDLIDIPAGHYELVVTDQKACTDSIAVNIIQPDSIQIVFETTEVTCIDQHDGTALAEAFGGNGGFEYEWSNGDLTAFTENLGSQYYSVTVTDILGCTQIDSVLIKKNFKGCVDPVNAFSPNADGYNDTWIIDNMHLYPEAELIIFNKWGNIVYKQTGLYEPWDGTFDGRDFPSEVYYYTINLNQPDRDKLTGTITIIR